VFWTGLLRDEQAPVTVMTKARHVEDAARASIKS
jgi:hypothetical protein